MVEFGDVLLAITVLERLRFFVIVIWKSIFIDKWQLMLEIGHHMFMVIDMAMKLIIISFERRWHFEDRDFC